MKVITFLSIIFLLFFTALPITGIAAFSSFADEWYAQEEASCVGANDYLSPVSKDINTGSHLSEGKSRTSPMTDTLSPSINIARETYESERDYEREPELVIKSVPEAAMAPKDRGRNDDAPVVVACSRQ